MITVYKCKIVVLFILIAALLAGCSGNNEETSTTPSTSNEKNVVTQKDENSDLSSKAPQDIPVLDSAKDLKVTKVGEGAVRGDLYYEIQYHMETSVEKTVEQYRKILDDLGLDYADQLEEEDYSAVGSTGTWEFHLMINPSPEIEGDTIVKILYLKL